MRTKNICFGLVVLIFSIPSLARAQPGERYELILGDLQRVILGVKETEEKESPNEVLVWGSYYGGNVSLVNKNIGGDTQVRLPILCLPIAIGAMTMNADLRVLGQIEPGTNGYIRFVENSRLICEMVGQKYQKYFRSKK